MTPAPQAGPVISLRSAAFGYADRAVLSGVDLDIHAGEVVALLGPNGSGKSTLLRGLLGLNDHLGGDVELFGTPRERFRDFTRLGYVPQHHSLSASVCATVAEVVAIGRLPHRPWWRPAQRTDAALVDQALDLVGLADRATEDVGTLSGGQQRRVLIARALAAEPDVLLLDEPTAGVDAPSQEVLAEVLGRLARRGATMLIATHELEALAGVVTRVVCTSDGRLDFDGSPPEYARHVCAGGPPSVHHHEERPPREGPALPGTPAGGPLDTLARRRSGG